jgi:hypothetical protein
MKNGILSALVFVSAVGAALAGGTSTLTNTPTITPTGTSTFTPLPTNTPILAPTWAPESAGPVPKEMQKKKSSNFMSSAGLGIGLSRSPHLRTAYGTGFYADLGTGYRVTDQFSLWLDLNLDLFDSKNDQLTNGNNFTIVEAVFWARYRFLPSDISPYIFFGPGLSYNEYRSDGGAVIDTYDYYEYIPINTIEFDFLAEGGLGLEVKLDKETAAFLQGKLTYDFTTAHFAGYGSTDSPNIVVPIEIGLLFGI